jgi:hypothetical protein
MGDCSGIESYPTKSLDFEQGMNIVSPHGNGRFNQTTSFGDLSLAELFSPAHSGLWLLGAEPTFVSPTATSEDTGQGRWQAGPAAVRGYLSKKFVLAVFLPHPSRILRTAYEPGIIVSS